MTDIFISYKSEEKHYAEKMAKELSNKGYSVWWDVDLLPGQQFMQEITSIISASKQVIVLWSKSSIQSDFVIAEAKLARDQGKLLPTVIDGKNTIAKLPIPFNSDNVLDLRSPDQIEQFVSNEVIPSLQALGIKPTNATPKDFNESRKSQEELSNEIKDLKNHIKNLQNEAAEASQRTSTEASKSKIAKLKKEIGKATNRIEQDTDVHNPWLVEILSNQSRILKELETALPAITVPWYKRTVNWAVAAAGFIAALLTIGPILKERQIAGIDKVYEYIGVIFVKVNSDDVTECDRLTGVTTDPRYGVPVRDFGFIRYNADNILAECNLAYSESNSDRDLTQLALGYYGLGNIDRANELLTEAAENGYSPAVWEILRLLTDQPQMIDRYSKAKDLISKYFTEHDPDYLAANAILDTSIYWNNDRTSSDILKALPALKEASIRGNPRASEQLARLYREKNIQNNLPDCHGNKCEEIAIEYYERLAKRGWGAAAKELGYMYRNGTVPDYTQDLHKAKLWFAQAKSLNDLNAIVADADLVLDSKFSPEYDETLMSNAFHDISQAAEKGNRWAFNYIGFIYKNEFEYRRAQSIPSDQAIRSGETRKNTYLLNLCQHITLERCLDNALSNYKLSANLGSTTAANNLAKIYRDGIPGGYIAKDHGTAAIWFEKAFQNGNADALYNKAELLIHTSNAGSKHNPSPTPENYADAVEILKISSERGSSKSTNYLGWVYEKKGVEFSLCDNEECNSLALEAYELSALQGNMTAAENLAKLYAHPDSNNINDTFNRELASHYYNLHYELSADSDSLVNAAKLWIDNDFNQDPSLDDIKIGRELLEKAKRANNHWSHNYWGYWLERYGHEYEQCDDGYSPERENCSTLARSEYEKAIELSPHYANALGSLGDLYTSGQGVYYDAKQAEEYYERAAYGDVIRALEKLNALYSEDTPGIVGITNLQLAGLIDTSEIVFNGDGNEANVLDSALSNISVNTAVTATLMEIVRKEHLTLAQLFHLDDNLQPYLIARLIIMQRLARIYDLYEFPDNLIFPFHQLMVSYSEALGQSEASPSTLSITDSVETNSIQAILSFLGYYQGEVDGKLGPQTNYQIDFFESYFDTRQDAYFAFTMLMEQLSELEYDTVDRILSKNSVDTIYGKPISDFFENDVYHNVPVVLKTSSEEGRIPGALIIESNSGSPKPNICLNQDIKTIDGTSLSSENKGYFAIEDALLYLNIGAERFEVTGIQRDAWDYC